MEITDPYRITDKDGNKRLVIKAEFTIIDNKQDKEHLVLTPTDLIHDLYGRIGGYRFYDKEHVEKETKGLVYPVDVVIIPYPNVGAIKGDTCFDREQGRIAYCGQKTHKSVVLCYGKEVPLELLEKIAKTDNLRKYIYLEVERVSDSILDNYRLKKVDGRCVLVDYQAPRFDTNQTIAIERFCNGEQFGISTLIDEDTITCGYGELKEGGFVYSLPDIYIKQIYGTNSFSEMKAKRNNDGR